MLKLIPPSDRSPNWRVRGTHFPRTPKAVNLDRSLGTPDAKTARSELAKLIKDIESGAFQKTIAAAPRTFSETLAAYALASDSSRRGLDRLVKYFDEKPIEEIDQQAIDACALALYPNGRPDTRNRWVYTPISAILNFAGIERKIRRPKGWRGNPRLHWLTAENMRKLVAAAREVDQTFGAYLTFLFYCGPRLSEALRLEWADVDLLRNYAYLRRTKNGEPQGVHLPPVVVAELGSLPFPHEGSVFGNPSRTTLYRKLVEASRRSGVHIPKGIKLHITRHTYGALMTQIGVDLIDTGRWKSDISASVYKHVDVSAEARRADLMPGADDRPQRRAQDV